MTRQAWGWGEQVETQPVGSQLGLVQIEKQSSSLFMERSEPKSWSRETFTAGLEAFFRAACQLKRGHCSP